MNRIVIRIETIKQYQVRLRGLLKVSTILELMNEGHLRVWRFRGWRRIVTVRLSQHRPINGESRAGLASQAAL